MMVYYQQITRIIVGRNLAIFQLCEITKKFWSVVSRPKSGGEMNCEKFRIGKIDERIDFKQFGPEKGGPGQSVLGGVWREGEISVNGRD